MSIKKILVVGASVLDRIIYVLNLPSPGETVIGNNMELYPGGKGSNQALAARLTGSEVRLISAVGADSNAEIVLKPLKNAGIDTSDIHIVDVVRTAEAVIAVDKNGNNTIVAYPGAYYCLTQEMLYANTEPFEWADWLLVQNEIKRETTDTAIILAKEHGCKVIFNAAPFSRREMAPISGIDVLIVNEVEASAMLLVADYTKLSDMEKCRLWSSINIKHKIVTLGEIGGEYFNGGDYVKHEAYPVKSIDTVGAGDVFCGILATFVAEGVEVEKAARMAHVGAALSTTKKGAQGGLVTREELSNFVNLT